MTQSGHASTSGHGVAVASQPAWIGDPAGPAVNRRGRASAEGAMAVGHPPVGGALCGSRPTRSVALEISAARERSGRAAARDPRASHRATADDGSINADP